MYISAPVVNHIYLTVLLQSREEYHECITVPGFTGSAHTFHSRRLDGQYLYILTAIKKLPRRMLHSQSPDGVPWIVARSHGGTFDGCTLETAERLLVMGIALGLVRVVRTQTDVCDVPYVVIDDDRLIRQERMKPLTKRLRKISRWHR